MKYKAYIKTRLYNLKSKELNDPAEAIIETGRRIHQELVDQLTNELLDSEKTKNYVREGKNHLLTYELEDWFTSVLQGSAYIESITENRLDYIAVGYIGEQTKIRTEDALRAYYCSKNTSPVAEWHWLIKVGEEDEEN